MGNKLRLTLWVSRQLFRNMFRRRRSVDYSEHQWTAKDDDLLDVPTAIAIRLSKDFDTVVEIGAAGGDRVAAIKKERPALTVIGMDISPHNGMKPYSIDGIEPNSLVFCVGTMSYMSEQEVRALMTGIKERGCTFLFFEPLPPFHRTKTTKRHSDSWYHPYSAIAEDCGLTAINQRWAHTGSLKNFEQWRGMLFRS